MADRNPLTVSCPNCLAEPCEACTQPTSTGRRSVDWYHSAREVEANIREAEYNAYASKVRLHSTWVPPFSEWLGMIYAQEIAPVANTRGRINNA